MFCPFFSDSSGLRAVNSIVNDLVLAMNDDAERISVRLMDVQVAREAQKLRNAPSMGVERRPIVCRVVRRTSGLQLR